jgi:AcrR family transcriptional regulator
MAPEYSGRGDAIRSMELLWNRVAATGSRGPKQGTDLEAVVRAAIELADAEGLEAVSMRRVAQRLGIGTMSLYTYVPGKGELLDLMLDTVHAERADDPPPIDDTPRARLEALARSQWAFHERHRWTLYIASGRAVLGPNELDAYEAALSVAAGLGVRARDAIAIVDAIGLFVRGAARDAAEAADAPRVTGMTEMEWWTERDAILTEKMSDEVTSARYPTLGRLGEQGGFDATGDAEDYNLTFILEDFEFGLQRLLDGIEAYVSRAAPPAEPAERIAGSPPAPARPSEGRRAPRR